MAVWEKKNSKYIYIYTHTTLTQRSLYCWIIFASCTCIGSLNDKRLDILRLSTHLIQGNADLRSVFSLQSDR